MENKVSTEEQRIADDAAEKETLLHHVFYWNQRCKAAERVINGILVNGDSDANIEDWTEWQQLKSSPSPIPVQEGLREDETIEEWDQEEEDKWLEDAKRENKKDD